MSYDISLYTKAFLKRAVTEKLGDWRDAEPFADDVADAMVEEILRAGCVEEAHDPDFVRFLAEKKVSPSRDFTIATDSVDARISLFSGSLVFSIKNSPKAEASIDYCCHFAKYLAGRYGLGFFDPQDGVAEYE